MNSSVSKVKIVLLVLAFGILPSSGAQRVFGESGNSIAELSLEDLVNFHSSVDLGFDRVLYCVDQIKSQSQNLTGAITSIPSYVRLDPGLTWRSTDHLELSVRGQNLLEGGHPELTSYKTPNVTEIPRSIFGKITWRF